MLDDTLALVSEPWRGNLRECIAMAATTRDWLEAPFVKCKAEIPEGTVTIKDMIGSQATKCIHVLARFAPKIESCGVWTDGRGFRAIETYPTACRGAKAIKRFLNGRDELKLDDLEDARICALVAYLFATERNALEGPGEGVPSSEGWICVTGKGTPI